MDMLAMMSDLASLGAAGIMGTMWLWERKLSRTRDQQITESHQRIARDEERLRKLTEVVEQNTAAMTRFAELQRQECEALRQLLEEIHHGRKTRAVI